MCAFCEIVECGLFLSSIHYNYSPIVSSSLTNMSIPNSRRTHSIQFNPNQTNPNPSHPIAPFALQKLGVIQNLNPKSELTKYTTFFHGEANPNLWTWTSLTQLPLYAYSSIGAASTYDTQWFWFFFLVIFCIKETKK